MSADNNNMLLGVDSKIKNASCSYLSLTWIDPSVSGHSNREIRERVNIANFVNILFFFQLLFRCEFWNFCYYTGIYVFYPAVRVVRYWPGVRLIRECVTIIIHFGVPMHACQRWSVMSQAVLYCTVWYQGLINSFISPCLLVSQYA